jgi:multiple sugar transport system substrate-binding protein
MKRALFSLFVVLLVIGVFGGSFASAATKVQWAVYGNQLQLDSYDKLVATFMASNPDIEVEILVIAGSVDERVAVLIAGGAAPDVVSVNNHNSLGVLWANGYADLSSMINNDSEYKASDYYPATFEPFYYKGQTWAVPVTFATIGTYVNTDMLSDNGLNTTINEWTWEDFKNINQRMTKDTNGDGLPDIYGSMINASTPTRLIQWFDQNDATLWNSTLTQSTFNNPRAIEVLQYFRDLVDARSISPSPLANITRDFIAGNIGMIQEVAGYDSNVMANASFSAAIAPLPMGVKKSTLVFTDGFAITSASKNKAAAWEFIKFLVSEEATQVRLEQGYIPAMRKKADVYMSYANALPGARHFIDSIAYGRALQYPLALGQYNSLMYNAMAKLWNGTASPQATAIQLQQQLTAALSL